MSRFRGEYEDDVAAGRERAAEGQRQYDQEQDRDYMRWKNQNAHLFAEQSLFEREGEWNFLPLTEESGRVSGFKVLLNGRHVAMVIPVRDDIVVMMISDKGDVKASYKRGQHVDAKLVLDRFTEAQGALPGGT